MASAVVASDGRNGVVLWYQGASLWAEIEEAGLRQLDELGLDDAPVGVSVWEGEYAITCGCSPGVGMCNCSLDACECAPEPVGSFRAPTDEEWGSIRAGRCPFPNDPGDPRNEAEET